MLRSKISFLLLFVIKESFKHNNRKLQVNKLKQLLKVIQFELLLGDVIEFENRSFRNFTGIYEYSPRPGKKEAQGMTSYSSYEDSQIEGHDSEHHQVKETNAEEVDGCLTQPSYDGISPTLDYGLVGNNLSNHGKEKHKQDG
ncbi:hypothetical protein VNO77_08246 [Canavalia gladiata]|uniref:Uncharacterized protein n=1 Tax=Canavalia gladiata TaxID=3824 RepID=A0AAN9M8E9_CANGL